MGYICNLSPELQKKAKEELNEDPARRDADIEHIRKWLQKQPHINARTDDWTILRFLRGCKFSLERTKEKLDMYYTCKTMIPEWFTNRDPQDKKTREILEMGLMLPLPCYDPKGRRVILGRWGYYNPHYLSYDELMKNAVVIFELLCEEDPVTSVDGIVMLSDCKGTSLAHLTAMTPVHAKKSAVLMQDGYPMRPKGLHYINTPPTFDAVFSIFKTFMKEKMRKRVHIHGNDLNSLHKSIPKEILPVEYGGTNGTVQDIIDYWVRRVDARRDWLLEDEKYRVDESKRPGKPKTTSDLFGVDGSFRQLTVD